jgi:long-subunit fatty acid transport protein
VASTAASYTYKNVAGQEVDDMTKLVFIEIAPGFAIDLPWNLKLGATYRATLAQFGREKGEAFNLDLEGWNFTGWKVGLQWQPIPWLQAGVTYRHKAVATVEADEATLMGVGVHNVSMDFVLPSKVAAGVRADVGPVGVAVDVEYSLNSQNQQSAIKAAMSPEGEPVDMLVSYFKWEDSLTLRGGVEYSILPKLLKARLGYIFDGKVSSGVYPTAFGTPPAPTHSFTGGLGTDFTLGGVGMEVNVAYAYRMGVVEVVQEDLDKQDPKCLSCSFPGEYDMRLHGIYLDTSVYF